MWWGCAGGHGQQIYIPSLYTVKWRGAQWQLDRPFLSSCLNVVKRWQDLEDPGPLAGQ